MTETLNWLGTHPAGACIIAGAAALCVLAVACRKHINDAISECQYQLRKMTGEHKSY